MIVKKYKADTETAAILAAKEDLGPEAVVLNVKTMKQRGFARFLNMIMWKSQPLWKKKNLNRK